MTAIMQYAYTGDVKKLKPAGWTFQKLYADNYKAYHWDDIFMYVRTQMVLEVSNLYPTQQAALIGFIIENADKSDEFWTQTRQMGEMGVWDLPIWMVTNFGRVVDHETNSKLVSESHAEWWDWCSRNPMNGTPITENPEGMAVLERRRTKEGGSDTFVVRPELVEKVLALHALHPLELIESKWTEEMYS